MGQDDKDNKDDPTMKNIKKSKPLAPGKVTKPTAMKMAYCKKLNLVIFTLVSKKIIICKFNCNSQRKSFETKGEYELEDMPTNLAVGIHKMTGKLQVIVTTQAIKSGMGPIKSQKKKKLEEE